MGRLSILQVAYPFAPVSRDAVGGAEQIVATLDAALTQLGHRSVVVACAGSRVQGTLVEVPAVHGLIDDRARAAVHAAVRRAIARALPAEAIDVVHLHGVDFEAYLPFGVPTVVTLHLPLDSYSAAALAAPVTYVCVSASQRHGCPVDSLTVPNGVALGAFAARISSRSRRGYALALGRVCPEKGFETAIAAATAAGVPLLVAGRAFGYAEHTRYFDEVLAPRLRAPHRWLGPIGGARKRRLLAGATCLVVPSRVAETSSLVAMEALASGTPVIVRPVGALPEIVEDGRTGFVADDVAEMAAAIRRVPALSRADCRRSAEARFSDVHMIERYLSIYRARVTRRDRASSPIAYGELRSTAELEALAPEWAQLWTRARATTPFQHPAWLVPWSRHLCRVALRVLTVRSAGRLVAMIPLGLGPDGALAFLGGDVSDYGDALVEPGGEAALVAALGALERPCVLAGLPPESLLACAPLAGAGDVDRDDTCPIVMLADAGSPSEPALTAPSIPAGFARRLAYARRRAERDGLRLEDLRHDTLGEYVDALFRLHSARWATRGEAGVLADAAVQRFHRDAARLLQRAGLLAMHALRDDQGRIAAISYGFQTGARAYLYLSGFDPALASRSPGALVIDRAMRAAHAAGARSFDFLRGAEPYKYHWGAEDRFRLRRVLHARPDERAWASP